MRLLERIKGRIPKRHKAAARLPVLSYEEIDESAKQELIDEATEERLADIEALDAALRSQN